MVVSSFVKTMIPLRCLAVGGNLGFLVYGAYLVYQLLARDERPEARLEVTGVLVTLLDSFAVEHLD